MSSIAAILMVIGILYAGEPNPLWVRMLAGACVGISMTIIFHAIKKSKN